ncbi:IspD/TarI family cytidylyltransferase [Gemelliphila palaticanis]|uniref:Ribitol-5-phosphate cytidylyltransferase n=1 Tax=Gemelliphila palaticanis TaxID=81950 RepID=A0ABX2SZB6_9BACL|nr:2-C-methyl-D-erythritol 4-phosphate cytidylyltransferase [Gemella palaticanis]MBF0715763.1 2-C-methyl-D-erythritol 4-phosphate cytidylyltransferase [Gemella palaticanis]NYS47693.1 2-C-methyl-D-erythritol 4-phosphate cytidylyltransferase [Gemella palaticanis]
MIYAGILAGGTGTRMGIGNIPKQFMMLGKKPIIIHTIEKFVLVPDFEKIVVGVHPDWVDYTDNLIDEHLGIFKEKIIVTEGGTDRNTTIEKIILEINKYKEIIDEDIIVTHDSVRPFITHRIIKDNIELALLNEAVDTVVEATDTIVESIDGNIISNIPNRSNYYQGQTPQSFKMKEFLNLYNSLDNTQKNILTDACKIFVISGKKVSLARGEYSNIKITTVTDLKIAKSMLEEE